MSAAFYLPFKFLWQAFGIRRYIPALADEYNIPEGLLLAGNDPIGTLPAGFPLKALCTAAARDEQDLTVSISDIGDEVIILPIGTSGAAVRMLYHIGILMISDQQRLRGWGLGKGTKSANSRFKDLQLPAVVDPEETGQA